MTALPDVSLLQMARLVADLIIAIGVLQNLVYIAELCVAGYVLARHRPIRRGDTLWQLFGDISPPIALLVPAYNEAATIVENIRSLLSLQYPSFEVIVVNDGSTDGTLAAVIGAFALVPVERSYDVQVPHRPLRGLYSSPEHPKLLVADKENGGKADALNAGINLSRAPLFCAVDADSVLEPDALLRVVQPFVEDPVRTAVVGGTVRIANGCGVRHGRVVDVALPRRLLPLLQTVEYLRAFLIARLAWSRLRALTIVSGAFGIFRRHVAVAVGGYSRDTVGEDMEIVVKIHRHMLEQRIDYLIRFLPEPVCWTEVPETLAVLARQRIRWQRGALETFFKHARMLLNPRYGRVGSLAFLNTLLADVVAPPVELLGYLVLPALWLLGAVSLDYLLAFLALVFACGIFVSVGSLILEEIELRRYPKIADLVRLTAAAIVENFGYRQINNVWRMIGSWRYLRGAKGWGEMARTGFRRA